ncbi:hypothetical protein AVEN_174405-1 [Araneus ventricosus]|uniref:Endonuclease/exonuclease/phosphatase domain-containing protein n=1 Tax=Araneus ventricosus TaxID=182803 RepID=A0A4Y2H033_ARAVE|nr:hypothetical protein AVEN_174405-1 [Araneus ventricosus]
MGINLKCLITPPIELADSPIEVVVLPFSSEILLIIILFSSHHLLLKIPSIAINLPNSQHITVSSIYRPLLGNICTTELDRIFNSNTKVIAIGDFNAKHSAWSSGQRNKNGIIIHDYICNKNLNILSPPEPTHFPYHINSASTLDF